LSLKLFADQLVEENMRTDDEDLWSARVKVLAELVEHHIEQEPKNVLLMAEVPGGTQTSSTCLN